MEILIILIVLALFAGLLLGPIGFFKAIAAGNKAARLERQIDRLSVDLEGVRTLCLKLRASTPIYEPAPYQAPQASVAVVEEEQPQVAPEAPEQTAEEVEALAEEIVPDEPVVDPVIEEVLDENKPTTLERLRELRQQHQDAEQTEQAPLPPVVDATESAEIEESEPVVESVETKPVEEEPTVAADQEEPIAAITNPHTHTEKNAAGSVPAPARRLTIEEVLAGKVFVWIGAIALVLTAAFLLKLGFDENIITIPVRVIGAGVFGLGLWCVGEWARKRVSLIAQALCGSGVAVLYGTIIAAENYQLLGQNSAVGFGLMALVTASAVVLSLRHGPAVAILGMLGGFMMPPLLMQDMSPTLGMVLYLIAIEVGVLAVTGKRGWFGISLMTLIFSVVWSLGYAIIGDNPHERTLTAMLVLGTAGAYLYHTARIHRDPAATSSLRKRVFGLSIAATCSAIGIIALLAVQGDYALRDLGMLGLVAAGTLVLARIDPRQLAMPFIAMGISLLVLLSNAAQSLPDVPSQLFITITVCFGGLFMLGGYICMWGNKHRRVFATMCAIAGPSFYGLIMFAGHDAFGLRDYWWPYTLGLAGFYALATLPMLLKRKAEHDWSIALFSVLSFALVCVTLGQGLNHPWLAVCLALVSAAAALIDWRLYIWPLRVAASVVAFVSAALLIAPGPFDLTIHGGPVFNTLLPMYALPAFAFGIIAWCAARAGSRDAAKHLTWLCISTLVGMLLVLTRNLFHPFDFIAESFQLYEWSTYASVLLLAGFVAHFFGYKLNNEPIRQATRVIVGLGAVIGLIGGLVPSNPLFQTNTVGGPTLAAGLLALYAAPAVLMWTWSRRPSIADVPAFADTLRVFSITLVTFFVGLQIRNGFQPDALRGNDLNMYELVTYAVAWLLMGGFIQRLNLRSQQRTATRIAGQIIFCLGLITTIVGSLAVFNPMLTTDSTGGWGLAGRMVVLYVLPAALMWAWSSGKTFADQPKMITILRSTSITFIALFVGLQIRNGFQSDDLQAQSLGLYECVSYMVAALSLGGFAQRLSKLYLKDTVTAIAGQVIFGIGLAITLIGSVVLFNPLFDKSAEGGWDLVLRMAVLYVLPAALLWLWSRGKTLADQAILISALRAMSIAFVAIFVGTMIRNAFHVEDLHTSRIGVFECTTYGLAWVALGYFLNIISPRCTLPQTTRNTGRTVFGLGLATLLLGNAVVLNPLWFRDTVGSLPVINGLWYLYGPTILILVLLARYARQHKLIAQARLAGYLAIALAFMLLSMFVRHGFSGDGLVLITSNLISAERYAYSLAWMLFGGSLLIAGVFTRLDTLRYGSLAVLLLAVGKVFLIDTANLDNLYRVFSFFGLGVTLIGLGYLYQSLVFKRDNPTNDTPSP